ncbi:MAG: hypothetical protein SO170_09625 [Butyribacter sp.]|nr:hypothetical protein [bacterium]MDY3855195.1 hypothetical protein [Butyribacter sp.]
MKQNKFSMNKIFWGLLFLLGAVCLLLSKMGYFPTINNISVYDILLTILFVWIVLEGIHNRNFFFILFGLSLIAIQYDEFLHITAITPWTLLSAALLASIGLTILFPSKNNKSKINQFEFADKGKKDFENSTDEVIYFKNSFGSSIKYVNTDALVNISLKNSFGEMKVYFDNAIIKNGVADVNLEASFGEIILYIPKTWYIEDHIKTSFASVKEENHNQSQGCPALRLYGEAAFGDITIVYI